MIRACIAGILSAFCLLIQSAPASADFLETFRTRGRSIYLLHAEPQPQEGQEAYATTDLGPKDRAHINTLSAIAEKSPFLPVNDVETMVRRIDRLTEEFETAKKGERLQRLRFDIAYEYFLLYLHFQNLKYGLGATEAVPVSDGELQQYLMLSHHYLQPFLERVTPVGESPLPGDTDDVTFQVRNDPTAYLNVNFLAMMLEVERLSGGWINPAREERNFRVSEAKTWHWLETLWKRANRKGVQMAYTPSAKRLFTLYELYLKYHFLGRSLNRDLPPDPLTDMNTRTLLTRLRDLSKTAGITSGTPYTHYVKEANMDSGSTAFIVSLYLARRGFSVLGSRTPTASKALLFSLFQAYYDQAAKEIRYNIPLRKRIYNELIVMGVETGNLRLMEDLLYPYGLMSMRIPEARRGGTFIGDSSRHTMAYLLANILEKKRVSGLSADSGRYAEMASTLINSLPTRRHDLWRYASVIHRCLAEYHSSAHEAQNETLAIRHSRKAFLILCKTLSVNGHAGDFEAFQKMPGADRLLELFLYYQKKYPTSPHAAVPEEYQAQHIIEMKLKQPTEAKG